MILRLIVPSLLLSVASYGETLRFAGVLGNSGEQGDPLVRFAEKSAAGLGVAVDPDGGLWDRGGDGRLNRYAVDGRLTGSYPLPSSDSANSKDTVVILGNDLLLKIGNRLFSLPFTAAPGTSPTPLNTEADRLSPGLRDGWAAASKGERVFLVNAAGETRDHTATSVEIDDLEIGPGGAIFIHSKGKLHNLGDSEAIALESPGDRPQWLDGSWFGSAWHGTLRRFDPSLRPDPGVVLGGASGWFIGYVEGNNELNHGRGMSYLGDDLYAVSGLEGVMHLMAWQPLERRFALIRRIGAVASCTALAINSEGHVWNHCGTWEWNNGPDSPLRHSVPPPEAPGLMGASLVEGDIMIAPGIRWGKKVIYYGAIDGPLKLSDAPDLPTGTIASTVVRDSDGPALVTSDGHGKGAIFRLGDDGSYHSKLADLALTPTPLIEKLTSLTSSGADTILAAADGQVIVFARNGGDWKESRRWNSWGTGADQKFGREIHLTVHAGTLWIADTGRHRILAFEAESGKPLASFGTTDQPGASIDLLHSPSTLSANGKRAVVFDSANQRIVKLELMR